MQHSATLSIILFSVNIQTSRLEVLLFSMNIYIYIYIYLYIYIYFKTFFASDHASGWSAVCT